MSALHESSLTTGRADDRIDTGKDKPEERFEKRNRTFSKIKSMFGGKNGNEGNEGVGVRANTRDNDETYEMWT